MVNKENTQMTDESVFGRSLRKDRRSIISGFDCQLAIDKAVFKGPIDDLSAQGFSMTKVPLAFCDESKIYRAIFSKDDSYFKITVIPRWSRPAPDGSGSHVGYKILDSDWKWVHFSMEILPADFAE